MGIKKLQEEVTIKDYTGMNIINSLMYCKEALKKETDPNKIELLSKRLTELKVELQNYKIGGDNNGNNR